MKGLVLAAGRGSRLNHYTKGENKCLIRLNGKPIIQYAVENLCGLKEIDECVIVVGYKADKVMQLIGNEVNGVKITYCRQESRKGLIDAMEAAKEALDGKDFFMALGDEYVHANRYKEAVTQFYATDCAGAIGIIEAEDMDMVRKTYTFRLDAEHGIHYFVEKPDKPFNGFMGTGNIIFEGSVCNLLERVPVNIIRGEKELVDLLNLILKNGHSLSWFAVGEKYINLNTSGDVERLMDEFSNIQLAN